MVEFVDYKPITVDPSVYTVDSEIPDISYFTEETTPSTKTSTTSETPSSSTYKFKWTSSLPASEQQTTGSSTSSAALGAVNFAQSKIGKKYSWGSTGQNDTYDCSGLIYKAYKEQGVNVPRSTDAWLSSNKQTVGSTEGQPGDVIITNSKGSKSGHHARLITKNLGNGKYECVEAKGKKDGVVTSTYSVDNSLLNIYRAKKGMKLIKKHCD